MCKQDTESVKVAPEIVLSNGEISKLYTWPVFRRGRVISRGGYLRTPWEGRQ